MRILPDLPGYNVQKINRARIAKGIKTAIAMGATHPLPPVIGRGKLWSGIPRDQGNPALLETPAFSASFSTNLLNIDLPYSETFLSSLAGLFRCVIFIALHG